MDVIEQINNCDPESKNKLAETGIYFLEYKIKKKFFKIFNFLNNSGLQDSNLNITL